MRVLTLSSVMQHVQLGQPLPFSVRSADKVLLLAAGQLIHDERQLDELFDRGAVVEAAELDALLRRQGGASDDPLRREAPRSTVPVSQLPGVWDHCTVSVTQALTGDTDNRREAIGTVAAQLIALVERSHDVAMWQVVRQHGDAGLPYGVTHSMNAATACLLTARRLQWSADEQRRAFHAALTMNLAMVELQNKLAHQVSPLTPLQRKVIQEHPLRSAELLQQAGITDEDWLRAVREHHELPDGSGYPAASTDASELAQLVRYADVYTALMSRRATRRAMSAREAGRELFQMASDNPLCHAMIKCFGVFPPGSFVRLASGELGVVTRNGHKAYHPQVAVLTTADGQPRRTPVARDSADEQHAVTALLAESAMPMRLSPVALAQAIAG